MIPTDQVLEKRVQSPSLKKEESTKPSSRSGSTTSAEQQDSSFHSTTTGDTGPVLEKQDDLTLFKSGSLTYKLIDHTPQPIAKLKLTIRCEQTGKPSQFYLDELKLYLHSSRSRYVYGLLKELGESGIPALNEEKIRRDLKTLATLLQEDYVKNNAPTQPAPIPKVIGKSYKEALAVLKSPDLWSIYLRDHLKLGYVGDNDARILGFVITLTRLVKKPLGLLIVSRSGAGKTILQESLGLFVPPENLITYTRISSTSLGYHGENGLKNKVLSIEEIDGALEAMHSIRILQGSQRLITSVTQTNPKTGQMNAETSKSTGPVTNILSTTNMRNMDSETRSRFVVATIDESADQTDRIFTQSDSFFEDETLLSDSEHDAICEKWHNIYRMIKPYRVKNTHIMKHMVCPTELLQYRREREKYKSLLDTIALIRQHQKKVHTGKDPNGKEEQYIEVDLEDVRIANKLAYEFFPYSLDELAPHTRKLGELIGEYCEEFEINNFTRKDIRDFTGWTNYAVCGALDELVEMEYIARLSGQNGIQYKYRLLVDPRKESRRRFEMTSVEELEKKMEAAKKEEKHKPTPKLEELVKW